MIGDEDDLAMQEGGTRFHEARRRYDLAEYSAQGAPVDDLAPAHGLLNGLLLGFAFFAGVAAGFLIGRFVTGGFS